MIQVPIHWHGVQCRHCHLFHKFLNFRQKLYNPKPECKHHIWSEALNNCIKFHRTAPSTFVFYTVKYQMLDYQIENDCIMKCSIYQWFHMREVLIKMTKKKLDIMWQFLRLYKKRLK